MSEWYSARTHHVLELLGVLEKEENSERMHDDEEAVDHVDAAR